MSVSIEEQIRCVKRELSLRLSVYPRRVEDRRMMQEVADREIEAMRAVLITLEGVEEKTGRQQRLL